MPKLTDSLLDAVRNSDITSYVSKWVKLKRSGSQYSGCCPFHEEKTPSFFVKNDGSQVFYCFGCGANGDIITFAELINSFDFIDAVKSLASHFNLDITEDSEVENPQRLKLKKAMNDAQRIYVQNAQLSTPSSYLKERGITQSVLTAYRVGYSPKGCLNAHPSFNGDIRERSGLFKDNRYILGNRITFPIGSYSGDIIAFAGRVTDAQQPKYLNSFNNDLFDKSRSLYGIDVAYKNRKSSSSLWLVEGYLDVLALAQAGHMNSVACMGSSLTRQQCDLIARHWDEVVLFFDGDSAGQKAIEAAQSIVGRARLTASVVRLEDGMDPADAVQKEIDIGKLYENRIDINEYMIKRCMVGFNGSSARKRTAQVRQCSNVLSNIKDPVTRESCRTWVSDNYSLNIPEQSSQNNQKKAYEPTLKGFEKSFLAHALAMEDPMELISQLDHENLNEGTFFTLVKESDCWKPGLSDHERLKALKEKRLQAELFSVMMDSGRHTSSLSAGDVLMQIKWHHYKVKLDRLVAKVENDLDLSVLEQINKLSLKKKKLENTLYSHEVRLKEAR